MSQLLHFYWQGKERSVAVAKNQETLQLHFVDPQIIDTIGSKVVLPLRNSKQAQQDPFNEAQWQKILEIIEAVGPTVKDQVVQ